MREFVAVLVAILAVAWLPLRTFRRSTMPSRLRFAAMVSGFALPLSLALFVARFGAVDGTLAVAFVVSALATAIAIVAPLVRERGSRSRDRRTIPSLRERASPSARTWGERLSYVVHLAGALLATLPLAVVVGMLAARFLPLARDLRFAIGLLVPLPIWVTGMCFAFVARRRTVVWILAIVSGLAIATLTSFPAHAQDAPAPYEPAPTEPAPAAQPRIEPPRLLELAEIVLPEGVSRPDADVTVLLRITIGVDGAVVDAEILEPTGSTFESVAADAARRSRFEPARRDGIAMPARIRLSVVVHALAPVPAEAPASAPILEAPRQESRSEPTTIDVVATVERTAERAERSAEAVDVVELDAARSSSADLGDVLARSEGVSLRRSTGLGGLMRFSLNGLGDERIRVFLDGVPLEFAGFPMSFGNMPVTILDRVEIFRGVVPIRFGADALGGAVNLVTSEHVDRFEANLSYQVGSFGTHRLSGTVAGRRERSGLFARGMGFLDSARNDYPVRVEIADDTGRQVWDTVRRFHDAYRAYGGAVEVGISDHRRVRLLSVRGFATQYDKDLQHNTIMSVPYGDVTYGEESYGGTARATIDLTDRLSVSGTAGYSRQRTDFLDQSYCIYNWYGDCVRMRRQPGEIEAEGYDQTLWQDAGFARLQLEGQLGSSWRLRGAIAPTYVNRNGTDRTTSPGARDPLDAERRMLNLVTSTELVGALFGDRLEMIGFVKNYVSRSRSDEVTAGDIVRHLARDTLRFGGGASARYAFDPDTYLKASYEYATRLPSPDETFGDGVLVTHNLGLAPEVSHNVNVGATVIRALPRFGALRFEGGGFGRFTDHLILLLGNDREFSYQNVYSARSLGIEVDGRYSFPHEHGFVSANLTYQDFRNVSDQGTFGSFDGDRIPNQPGILANFEFRGVVRDLGQSDELSFGATARVVSAYYRSWESLGTRASKQSIPMQFVATANVAYGFRVDHLRATASLEARNLTNARVFDFFGVQRAGRAFYLQLTLEL